MSEVQSLESQRAPLKSRRIPDKFNRNAVRLVTEEQSFLPPFLGVHLSVNSGPPHSAKAGESLKLPAFCTCKAFAPAMPMPFIL